MLPPVLWETENAVTFVIKCFISFLSPQRRLLYDYWELFSDQWRRSYADWQEKLGRIRICPAPHSVLLVLIMPGNVSTKVDSHNPVTPKRALHRYDSGMCSVCCKYWHDQVGIMSWVTYRPQFSSVTMTKTEAPPLDLGKKQIFTKVWCISKSTVRWFCLSQFIDRVQLLV